MFVRFVLSKDLKPGMVVGKTFYNNSLSVLLRKGVALTETNIRSIKRIKINGIYIDDELTRNIIIQPLIDDELKLKFATEIKSIYSSARSSHIPKSHSIEDIINTIIEQISSKPNHIVNLFSLKSFDDYTFQHSVDVCILSVVVGLNKKLSHPLLLNLALAAMYHDIGKMFIDRNILNKKGRLTDEEYAIVKSHPTLGVEYLKKIHVFRHDIEMGVLHHHERVDGTGYPYGLPGGEIGLFAKVIAIADVFDAITSERCYKHSMLPSEAIEYIMSNAGLHFDYEMIQLFISSVSAYPTGLTVKLSNGLTGIVAENYEGFTLRPKIMIISDEPGTEPYYINLKDDTSAQIITIVDVMR